MGAHEQRHVAFVRVRGGARMWVGPSEGQRLIVARGLEKRGVERMLGTATHSGA